MTAPETANPIARRWFLERCGFGLGTAALAHLLQRDAGAATRQPHFAPKAKNVIFLFQAGGPSHLELFDYKPELAKFDGTLPPPDLLDGYRAAFIDPNSKLLGPKYKFQKAGQSGFEISELLPHLATVVDDVAFVRSTVTDAFNHAPAQLLMSTGAQQFGRPSMGAWVTYGLGSESEDLPGFIVLNSSDSGPSAGTALWGAGFLPTVHQGVPFRSGGEPVLFLSNPRGITERVQRDTLDAINGLNRIQLERMGDPEIQTRIRSFELAFRMQSAAPALMDISNEAPETLELYGAEPGKASFANNCLLARRLVEKGVRFVQLYHEAWDHHANLTKGIQQVAKDVDQGSAALIKDLKRRGLLDDTLVLWGGEFGRTPMTQDTNGIGDGRDHHPGAFTTWLAGAGIRPGITLGRTDELGFRTVEDKVHVHDLHATVLHLLGFDHTKLTYRFQGRDFRLTDVSGAVAEKLLV